MPPAFSVFLPATATDTSGAVTGRPPVSASPEHRDVHGEAPELTAFTRHVIVCEPPAASGPR